MQESGQVQVVQLPSLPTKIISPLQVLQWLMNNCQNDKTYPLFQIYTKNSWAPLTAPKVRSFLKLVIISLGWSPNTYTFHTFRCSGASLAFDSNVEFSKIKQHGHWRSKAIWTYLNATPTATSNVPTTFQRSILNT